MYDALRSIRPYKKEYTHQDSVDLIYKESGISFDPTIVAAFKEIELDIKALFDNTYKTFAETPH